MGEEEKKAIEKLDYELTESYVHDIGISKETLKLFKDVIEKQQKEIEELKEDLSKKVKALDIAMSNPDYICKDKIKAEIKDLEDLMILFTNDKEKFNRYKYARNVLEKILGE